MTSSDSIPSEIRASDFAQLVTDIKQAARRYYDVTGKPLGVTGELAELEAARLLGLQLAPPRQLGWDATRTLPSGAKERIQIKGRWQMNGPRPQARMGAVDLKKPFDSVMLVLFDEQLRVKTIHRMSRHDVERLLHAPGSRARNVRGQLSVGAFTKQGELVWPPIRPRLETQSATDALLDGVADALMAPGVLRELCGPKRPAERNTRERQLERLVADVATSVLQPSAVHVTSRLGTALALPDVGYPLDIRADIVACLEDGADVIEVKSGRTDYSRFDRVVGKAMRRHLEAIGDPNAQPWEVEQDLLRLLHVLDVVPQVRSAQLIIVDAYEGTGRTWTTQLGSADCLASIATTRVIREHASRIVEATSIRTVAMDGLSARVIHCVLSRQ